MGADRVRVLTLALVSLMLIVMTTLMLDWFIYEVKGIGTVSIGLRSVTECEVGARCRELDTSLVRGFYKTFANIAFWVSMLFAVVVAVQAGFRIITGAANGAVNVPGYALGMGAFAAAGAAGYLFSPELISGTTVFGTLTSERTWAPSLLMLADLVGIATLYYATHHATSDDGASYKPLAPLKPAPRAPSISEAEPADPVAKVKSFVPGSKPITIPIPAIVRNKLKYTAITAEITRAGIDARREDGETNLVMWRDVVGIVARRLPPVYEGTTFVDIVSTMGATLRVLPWTRLTGDPIEGQSEARARAFAKLVVFYCPDAQLDKATRAFVDRDEPAAQLPDLETLDEHDKRLA